MGMRDPSAGRILLGDPDISDWHTREIREDHKVSATMQGYFENFIKTGSPNGAGLPSWPIGTVNAGGQVQRMRIDVDSRVELEPRARYLFLDQVYSGAKR